MQFPSLTYFSAILNLFLKLSPLANIRCPSPEDDRLTFSRASAIYRNEYHNNNYAALIMACAIVRHIQMMNEAIQAAEAIRIHCVVAQRNMLDSCFDVCAVSQGRFTPAYVRVKSQEF